MAEKPDDGKTGTDSKASATGEKPYIHSENPRLLADHEDYMGEPRRVRGIQDVSVGDVIEFSYEAEPRLVFVLNPNYKLQLHGLTLGKLTHRVLMIEVVGQMRPDDTTQEFYNRVVKRENVARTDAYRTFDVRKMGNITIRPYKKHA